MRRGFLFGGSGLLLGGVIMIGLLAFVPSQISFGFQPKTCVDRSVYLWGAHAETRDGMMVSVEGGKLCIQPTTASTGDISGISALVWRGSVAPHS